MNAVVSTPGDRWYELAVVGGFANTTFDEGTPDGEVAEILERYVSLALAYLNGRRSTTRSRVLKIPAIVVETDGEPVELHLSLGDAARAIIRPRKQPAEGRHTR